MTVKELQTILKDGLASGRITEDSSVEIGVPCEMEESEEGAFAHTVLNTPVKWGEVFDPEPDEVEPAVVLNLDHNHMFSTYNTYELVLGEF